MFLTCCDSSRIFARARTLPSCPCFDAQLGRLGDGLAATDLPSKVLKWTGMAPGEKTRVLDTIVIMPGATSY